MPCRPLYDKDGRPLGIVCSRGRGRKADVRRAPKCQEKGCTWFADYHCDYVVGKRTCDRRLCSGHAVLVGPDTHFCPAHDRKADSEKHARVAGQLDLFAQ